MTLQGDINNEADTGLPEIFEEFGEKKREAFLEIKEYKDKGIPVIGMYCAYFPTELAMAVGAIPVGLCSFANETIPAAERDLPKSIVSSGKIKLWNLRSVTDARSFTLQTGNR